MKTRPWLVFAAMLLATQASADAQNYDPGKWPCVQRLVPSVGAATVWPYPELLPLSSEQQSSGEDPQIADYVSRLVLGDGSAIESVAREFAAQTQSDRHSRNRRLVLLFVGAVDLLNRKRARQLRGIFVFAQRQREITAAIVADQSAMMAGNDSEDLAQRVNWNVRLYDAREKRLQFLCERPVLLEQRAFFVGRAVAAQIEP